MGASMSSSFLYKIVSIVEIICSTVIAVFGANTFLLFRGRGEEFQAEKDMIQYSSIVAVVQSLFTFIATFFLIGCHHAALREELQAAQEAAASETKRPSQIGRQYSLRRKAIAPTWIAWTLISVASLLFVFIAPVHYCIQNDSDRENLKKLMVGDESVDRNKFGFCYSDAPELAPMRNSLKDLYSFSVISLLFKALFILMVYRNWRSEMESQKKIIIYMDEPADTETPNNCENEMGPSKEPSQASSPSKEPVEPGSNPKVTVSINSPSPTEERRKVAASGSGSGRVAGGTNGKEDKTELISEKRKNP